RDSCSSTRLGTHRYSGDDSQSGRGTQANTYSDRTRSQGASSDTGEGSLVRRLNRRPLYGRHAVDSGAFFCRVWRAACAEVYCDVAFAHTTTRGLVAAPLGQVTVLSLTRVTAPLRAPQ